MLVRGPFLKAFSTGFELRAGSENLGVLKTFLKNAKILGAGINVWGLKPMQKTSKNFGGRGQCLCNDPVTVNQI